MTLFLIYLVAGVTTGSIYAIAASGLVVTYSTSRIFNFAHGGIGAFLAFVCYWLWVQWGLPEWLSIVISVVLIGGAIGVGLDRFIMRWLEGVPVAQRIALTLALLIAFEGATQLIFGSELRTMPPLIGSGVITIGGVTITADDLLDFGCAVIICGGLGLVFRHTRIGTTMRAVVEDRQLAEMHRIRPHRVTALTWSLGTMLAGLAAILLAPTITLNISDLSLLIVSAYAAAVVGRLTSLPKTFAAAMVLGIGSSMLIGYLPSSSLFVQSLSSALPFVVLFAALILDRRGEQGLHRIKVAREPRPPRMRTTLGFGTSGVLIATILGALLSQVNALVLAQGLVYAAVLLSLVLLTGIGGQVSLAQFSFMGLGAVLLTHLDHALPYWLSLILAVGATALVGGIVAIPALRLRGIYLALLTLAFAVLMDEIVFVAPSIFAVQGTALTVPVPHIGGAALDTPARMIPLLAVIAAAYGILVLAVRRGRFGRRLAAMRDSPAAASALGLDIVRTKVAVFAISAGMAGLAGCMFGGLQQQVTASEFNYLASLNAVLIITLWGLSNVPAAYIGAGFYVFGFLELPRWISSSNVVLGMQQLGLGLAVFGMARNPQGVVRQTVDDHRARRARKHAGRRGALDGEPPAEVPAVTTAKGIGVSR